MSIAPIHPTSARSTISTRGISRWNRRRAFFCASRLFRARSIWRWIAWRSCSRPPLPLLDLLEHRLGDPVIRIALAEVRERLVSLVVPSLPATLRDALEPFLRSEE